ncbi:receptor expression-enhancing protein 4 [Trichinella spiralis]|uniref:receptor expression-enhancing protein 4 n=1 Tax=Trichinella spiralis TaxID=6334 RepID=UPI0001EFD140|nr:receptor expression-enhancing protein 4 [Trichinella spiralis]
MDKKTTIDNAIPEYDLDISFEFFRLQHDACQKHSQFYIATSFSHSSNMLKAISRQVTRLCATSWRKQYTSINTVQPDLIYIYTVCHLYIFDGTACESSNILESAERSTLLSPPLDKCFLDSTELCSAGSSHSNLYLSFFDKSNDECMPVSWFRMFLAEHDKLWNRKIADQMRNLVNDRKYTLKHLYLKIEQLQSSHRELEIQMARMADDKRNEVTLSELENCKTAGLDTKSRSDEAVMTFVQHKDACVWTNEEELKCCSRETEKTKVEPKLSSSDVVSRKSEKYEKIVHLNKQVCELNLKLKSKDFEIKGLQNEVEKLKLKLNAKNRTEPKKVERVAVLKKEFKEVGNVRTNAKVESKILNKPSHGMKSCSTEINDKTNLTVDNSEKSKRYVRRSAASITNGKSSTAAKENKISREEKFSMKLSHLGNAKKKESRPFHLISQSLVLLLNYMLSVLLCRVLTLLCGGLYPAYRSFKALKSKNGREHVKWMMYWIVFAVFLNLETLADIFLGIWLPFYYEMKMWFILWLMLPYTRGSTVLYRKFIHPILERHEKDIEEYLSQAKHQGYTTLVKLGTRGMLYAREVVASVALKGQEHLVNQLRKSYSVGDLTSARDFNQTDSDSVKERVWTGYYDDGNQLVEEEFDYLYEGSGKDTIGEDSSSLERTRTMTTRRRAQATGVQPPAYSTLPRRRRRDGTL